MHKLIPAVKNYAWGASQEHNFVKDIYVTNVMMLDGTIEQLEKIEKEKNWAEIWIGSHKSGPARLITGESITAKTDGELSFLFKILSIESCLSIQTHPDKQWAVKLHETQPQHYPDPHPKPEMAVAIDFLEAFCGYCDHAETELNLKRYASFYELLKAEYPAVESFAADQHPKNIEQLIAHFLSLKHEQIEQLVNRLIADCQAIETKEFRDDVILRVAKQFGADVGLLVSLTLKLVKLAPFEYIALGPFIPHAYISGNVIECMAPSDNVIRLGLTPKFKDVKSFVETYDYKALGDPKQTAVSRDFPDTGLQVLEYPTDFSEFFDLAIVTRGANTNKTDFQLELEVTSDTIVFNLGESIELNGLLVRNYDSFLLKPGKVLLEAEEENVRLVIVAKGLKSANWNIKKVSN